MTPFLSLLKRTSEKLWGRWYEGHEPPGRLEQQVAIWARAHPRATRVEWAAYALSLGHASWREAWERGFQWAEREEQKPDPGPVIEGFDPAAVPELEDGEVLDAEEPSVTDEQAVAALAYRAWEQAQQARGPARKM